MYLWSLLHGHVTSFCPAASGAPTECRHFTTSPDSPRTSSTLRPMRVISFMLTATYAESEISTPMCAIGEPSGPMLNGTTYRVRPRMQPLNRPCSVARISTGSTQLLVGPASSCDFEQMKVRSSTRATSEGSDHARYELGRSFSFSFLNVPAATRSAHRRSYSPSEPSHQWMWSGCLNPATL